MLRVHLSWLPALVGAALVLIAQGVWAQDARIPLQALPLRDLSHFRAGDNWHVVGGVSANPDRAAPLETTPGTGIVVNSAAAGAGEHLVTTWDHGDIELELDYLLPHGSNSGLYLQGRYEVQLYDSWGQRHPTYADAGGIYQRWDEARGAGRQGYEGIPPLQNSIRAPGLWNHLRIVFQAPRFDANGRKTQDATFVVVEHNEVVVQENVAVTGPTRAAAFADEQPMGPLMIQGDHGPVAFRNLRYKRYGNDLVTLTDVRHQLHEGAFESTDAYADTAPVQEGASRGFDWRVGGAEDQFALTFQGNLHVPAAATYLFGLNLNWVSDDPHFSGRVVGGGRLTIDGQPVFEHAGADRTIAGTVTLEEGAHPFTLTYFKNRPGAPPVAEFFVEGTGVRHHLLNVPGSLPDPPPTRPITVDPTGEPVTLRSFVWRDGTKRVKAMSVGDPSGVHYTVDLDQGALLYVWRGAFLDAAPMWHSRGSDQTALPLGSVVPFSGAPPLAVLATDNAPWPDSTETHAYRLRGYTLDEERRPIFEYTSYGLEVQDALVPQARSEGQVLTRHLEIKGGSRDDLWLRLANGEQVVDRGGNLYAVDGVYYIEMQETGGRQPVVRTQGGQQELLVPVQFQGDEARAAYSIIW